MSLSKHSSTGCLQLLGALLSSCQLFQNYKENNILKSFLWNNLLWHNPLWDNLRWDNQRLNNNCEVIGCGRLSYRIISEKSPKSSAHHVGAGTSAGDGAVAVLLASVYGQVHQGS